MMHILLIFIFYNKLLQISQTEQKAITIMNLDALFRFFFGEKPVSVSSPEEPVSVSSPEKPVSVSSPEKPVSVSSPEKPVSVSSPEQLSCDEYLREWYEKVFCGKIDYEVAKMTEIQRSSLANFCKLKRTSPSIDIDSMSESELLHYILNDVLGYENITSQYYIKRHSFDRNHDNAEMIIMMTLIEIICGSTDIDNDHAYFTDLKDVLESKNISSMLTFYITPEHKNAIELGHNYKCCVNFALHKNSEFHPLTGVKTNYMNYLHAFTPGRLGMKFEKFLPKDYGVKPSTLELEIQKSVKKLKKGKIQDPKLEELLKKFETISLNHLNFTTMTNSFIKETRTLSKRQILDLAMNCFNP